jgi:hypothetical protein
VDGQLKEADFEQFLESTDTTSFIVIKDDAILYEGYFNGKHSAGGLDAGVWRLGCDGS